MDSWKINNSLVAGRKFGASHFVLLSAIYCVPSEDKINQILPIGGPGKPLTALEPGEMLFRLLGKEPKFLKVPIETLDLAIGVVYFLGAKLKFEAELEKEAEKNAEFSYSIVRPTAFFKSLGGQVELVKDGKLYVIFGDGKLCACKPISEPDLASFIADCVLSENKINQILPIGGLGKALTPLEQGEILYRLRGKEPKFLKVPIEIMDFAIGVLDFLVKVFPSLEDAAEFGKIGRYYAAESMKLESTMHRKHRVMERTRWKNSLRRYVVETVLAVVTIRHHLPSDGTLQFGTAKTVLWTAMYLPYYMLVPFDSSLLLILSPVNSCALVTVFDSTLL
ncbi:hypothetical protein ACH5RR_031166 [Cinchona calisaya]|uniref:NmrA-like domain-containing protein n=1 Tax=Cinchona calisaya TaxID=153742 RepID=A0ABD2YEF0_9GENT